MNHGKYQTEWNLSPLFESDEKAQDERREIENKLKEFVEKWRNRNDYLEKPEVLSEALSEYDEWERVYSNGGGERYYYYLRTQQDENNPELKAKYNQINDFSIKCENEMQFFVLRLAKVPADRQKTFLESKELSAYHHFLEKLFAEAQYLLGEDEEKILNLKSTPAYSNWRKMTSGFLSRETREVLTEEGTREKKSFSEIQNMLQTSNTDVCDSAGKAINEVLVKYVDVAEAEINSILQDKKINDELRGFVRPDAARHLSDDISSTSVDALVEAVSDHFSISRDFYQFKAELFGVKSLPYHWRSLVYGDINKEYSYEDAVVLLRKVFSNLDPEFSQIFERFVDEGRIDVYPRQGKHGGAFCMGNLISQPIYVFLNYTNKAGDVSTFAHEMGHGINDELIKAKQNALNFGTPLSTAEVASTFMEDFALEELRGEADEETKLAFMVAKLDDDIATIFRQVAAYQFEKELHNALREKGYLSKEEIGAIFQKHMADYMGSAVEQTSGSENWWVYWQHFRTFFYVYSYASGLLISKSLQSSVRRDHKFMQKVKVFFSAGLSDSPTNIFRGLGVDIEDKTFWEKGLLEVAALLAEARVLAKKLGRTQ
ncbi:MAG: M3 family oligoendopeptidase [Patescibacteria group bacterium]|jgi:oligoendopeptidase F